MRVKKQITKIISHLEETKITVGGSGVRYSEYTLEMFRNMRFLHNASKLEGTRAYIAGYGLETEDLESYASSVWHLTNRARNDSRFPQDLRDRLLAHLEGCEVHSPTFLDTVSELEDKINFSPECARPVEYDPPLNMGKLPSFDYPPVDPLVIRTASELEADYPDFNQSFLRAFWTKDGRPSYNVSGRGVKAYRKQLQKMSSNPVSTLEPIVPELILADLKMKEEWGFRRSSIDFNVSLLKYRHLFERDSSIGYIPYKFLEVVESDFKEAKGMKKKHIVDAAMDIFESMIQQLEDYINTEGVVPEPVFSLVEQEMVKYEIIWNHDNLDNPEVTREQMDESLEKVRLFYMSSIFDYMLSVLCYKPISESVRHYQSAIGVKVESGGLQEIWRIMKMETYLTDDQRRIIKKWKSRGRNLARRRYGQGDWKRYDQTLVALVLAFVAAFSFSFFRWTEESGVSYDAYLLLFKQFIASVVQKVMYVYAYGTYEVFGCMFSGKYITSIGDTIYQMYLLKMYQGRLLDKYPDSELLRDIIEYKFMMFVFYGDDHTGGWPELMDGKFYLYDETSLLRDFICFCQNVFGMQHKESEFKLFDDLYGRRCFTKVGDIYVEDLNQAKEGPTFLKNQVVELWIRSGEDESYQTLGYLPYRDTRDVAVKLVLTLKSSGNVKTAVQSTMSIARLCSGNPEAYSMCYLMYQRLAPLAGEITTDDWDYYKANVGENSVRRAMKTGSFPSYDELILDQREGDGYVPKDFHGNITTSTMYSHRSEGVDHIQSISKGDIRINDRTMLDELEEMIYESDFSKVVDHVQYDW